MDAEALARKTLDAYELIGEGDWTPQDVWGHRAIEALLAALRLRDERLAGLLSWADELDAGDTVPETATLRNFAYIDSGPA